MAKLNYTVLMSTDGYVADKNGNFDWAEPDEQVHSFINELIRNEGTYLYGHRMYEVMAACQTVPTHDQPSHIADFANIWRATDKVVYSKTLKTASSPKTRVEQHFWARRDSAAAGLGFTRHRRRRAHSRHPRVQGRISRCLSPVHRTHHCWGMVIVPSQAKSVLSWRFTTDHQQAMPPDPACTTESGTAVAKNSTLDWKEGL